MSGAWLFDLGNTRLKCAPLLAGVPGPVQALAHDRADTLEAALDAALPPRFDVAYVASVAGEATRVALLDALTRRCGRLERAVTSAAYAGLRIAYAEPARLGVDRFLAMLGARARSAAPVLVCGVGTALTLDLVDAGGQHLGGRIAPSPQLMREALHARAPQLPLAGGDWLDWAADTDDALASGCNGAAAALVGEAVALARMRFGAALRVVVHGGGVGPLLPRLGDVEHRPALVLEGLAIWAGATQTAT
jgi:type III pantothenate kinase